MAINIPLLDGWKIRSDSQQYILIRTDNGREISEGYCNSIEHCVEIFLDKKIRSFDSTSIELLLKEIKSLSTRCNNALQPLKLRVVSGNGGSK